MKCTVVSIKAFALKREAALLEIQNISDIVNYIDELSAVIFDLDDTLYSEKMYVRSGFRAIAQMLPDIQNVEERLWTFFQQKKIAINELLIEENLFSKELEMKCLEAYRNNTPILTLYPDVKETLSAIKNKKKFLGMITDGRPNGQRAKINALGIEGLFDKIIITDELGGIEYRKPSPAAFELMQKELSLKMSNSVPFNRMCYVGDNVNKDFIAPVQLGMQTFFFHNPDGLYYSK